MANILSTDDSQFIGGVGNWDTVSIHTALSMSATPAPSGGGNNLVLTETTATVGGIGRAVNARIFRPHYPTLSGTSYMFSIDVLLDPANAADPAGVGFIAQVVSYEAGGAGLQEGSVFVPALAPGWATVTIPSTTITRVGSPLYVGIGVFFTQETGGSTTGLLLNDKAYVANVSLSTPVVGVGGWGVGMVRMGAN